MKNKASPLQPILSAEITSPVGRLVLKASVDGITHLTVSHVNNEPDASIDVELISIDSLDEALSKDASTPAQMHLMNTLKQLKQYFAGSLKNFSVPLAAKGTEFQQQVWQALRQTPYASSCSYSDIAQQIERPKAVRAVGAANGANPIAIVVPCHRVIGKSGKLTGYAHGLAMKEYLLALEAKHSHLA